jgi:transcriptional regulator with XRE-family HTH domain
MLDGYIYLSVATVYACRQEEVPKLPGRRPPSVRARQLAAELRRLRAAATLTGDEVAGRLGWSPSKLSRIETGHTAITAEDLLSLLEMYQVSSPLRDRLVKLARSASQRGWWDAYDDMLREGYSTLLALEDEAKSEFWYGQMLIPGLLQTHRYAREVIGSRDEVWPPGEVARRVTVRATAQRVLTKEEPLELVVVLDEACLWRRVGGAAIMTEQLSHLIDMARLPNVTLQVLRFAAGFHPGLTSAFTILQFPEEGASDVVFLENMTSDLFIEKESDVYRYIRSFAALQRLALGEQESIAVISRIASEIESASEE